MMATGRAAGCTHGHARAYVRAARAQVLWPPSGLGGPGVKLQLRPPTPRHHTPAVCGPSTSSGSGPPEAPLSGVERTPQPAGLTLYNTLRGLVNTGGVPPAFFLTRK